MSRAESKARTRDALLASARRVFAEKGFHAATVEEIASGAGFTRGAFYANFADKHEAFWAVAEDEDAALFRDLEPELGTDQDWAALSVLDRWFRRLFEDQPLEQAFAEVQSLGAEDDRRRLVELYAANRRRIAVVVGEQAEERGVVLAATPHDLASVFLAIADGLRVQRRLDRDAVPLSLVTDAFAYLWLGAASAAADPAVLNRGSGTPTPDPPPRGRRRS